VAGPAVCGEPADRVVEMATEEVGAPVTLDDLTERSGLVATGLVGSVTEGSVVGPGGSELRQALVSFDLDEVWKGSAPDGMLVAVDGWVAGDDGWREVILDGQCLPEPGEEYVLFLVDAGGRYGATHFLTARSGILQVNEGFVVANVRRPLARSLHGMAVEDLESAVRAATAPG
jgi:hypothetical protein